MERVTVRGDGAFRPEEAIGMGVGVECLETGRLYGKKGEEKGLSQREAESTLRVFIGVERMTVDKEHGPDRGVGGHVKERATAHSWVDHSTRVGQVELVSSKHVEQALASIPPSDRCDCPHVPASVPGMYEVKKNGPPEEVQLRIGRAGADVEE
uniref:Unplaced genomic scaffold supercont1.26, whole genome shotgun sequence n=1 Tax=Cryptococcus bacillisporus CA1280 TaxID=1296109 RepID=A0A0D0TDS5_CRYGA|nr:hypothetical protein I312_06242 [Cryptococcus bacillisporus CA1280]